MQLRITGEGSDTLQNPVRDFEITLISCDFMISMKSMLISKYFQLHNLIVFYQAFKCKLQVKAHLTHVLLVCFIVQPIAPLSYM